MKARYKVMLAALSIVALILIFADINPQPALEDTSTNDNAVLPADTVTSATGYVGILYGNDNNTGNEMLITLNGTDGSIVQLVDMPDGTIYDAINGAMVTVSGVWADADPTSTVDLPVLDVEMLRIVSNDAHEALQAAVTGNTRWLNVACRFADMDDEPQPREYFQNMMRNAAPGMDHYWRQTSAGLVDIDGSASYGWYQLPNDKLYYTRAAAANTGMALKLLMQHCVEQAIVKDGVDVKQFGGINMMLNDTFGCCAWGGRMSLNIDGELIYFRTTWLPPWAYNSLHVIAHEMGHGWGLPHSSGPYGNVYDSAWDVMSGGSRMVDQCKISYQDFGCHQVGTISFHLDMLGWMPEARKVTVYPGDSTVVMLDSLTTQTSTMDMLMVQIPVHGSDTHFYTVEVRSFTGYDRNLPGEAVILHEVKRDRSEPAHVVDADNNGNPNDEGAMWLPGETFESSVDKVKVEVLQRLGSSFVVRVSNG